MCVCKQTALVLLPPPAPVTHEKNAAADKNCVNQICTNDFEITFGAHSRAVHPVLAFSRCFFWGEMKESSLLVHPSPSSFLRIERASLTKSRAIFNCLSYWNLHIFTRANTGTHFFCNMGE